MLNYNNITNDFKGDKSSVKVSLAKYYSYEKKRYYPDGKNVIFDFSEKEYEIAVWLSKTFNENVYINPRVNCPEGIKTSDYIFKSERWDLKTIIGNSTQVFYHAIYKNKEQSSNYIFDITKSNINMKEVLELANILYGRSDITFLDKIIILDNNEFLVLKRV
ncbi:hypothetical protein EGP99_03430 [bacterium]|nr:hypothetical protein [bacterium]